MTTEQHDLTIRPITGPEELDLFCQLPYVLNQEFANDLDQRRRRPDWMWMALRGDRLLARAAWWSRPDGAAPLLMDVFDVVDDVTFPDRLAMGVHLLRTAMGEVVPSGAVPPEYGRFIPPDWRDDGATRRVVEDRIIALEQVGPSCSSSACAWNGDRGHPSRRRRGGWRSGRSATATTSSP